jgi:hypothetical protein
LTEEGLVVNIKKPKHLLPNTIFVAYCKPLGRRTTQSPFLSVITFSSPTIFSNSAGLEPGYLNFLLADFAIKYVYNTWSMTTMADSIGIDLALQCEPVSG